jgi:hypothetical protein
MEKRSAPCTSHPSRLSPSGCLESVLLCSQNHSRHPAMKDKWLTTQLIDGHSCGTCFKAKTRCIPRADGGPCER